MVLLLRPIGKSGGRGGEVEDCSMRTNVAALLEIGGAALQYARRRHRREERDDHCWHARRREHRRLVEARCAILQHVFALHARLLGLGRVLLELLLRPRTLRTELGHNKRGCVVQAAKKVRQLSKTDLGGT